MNYLKTVIVAFFCMSVAYAQDYKNTKLPVEKRLQSLLSQMTLEEKIDYIGGYKGFYIRPIERLGLPAIKLTDGPVGTHKDGKSTAYPAAILWAATWDEKLVFQLGEQLGRDSRSRGAHILLAPGVNIHRAPMAGRNFEYVGEDPYLASRMAVNYINGLQSKGVAGTVKHFAANNQEWDRDHASSNIDERTLHEIYLPAFKAAVKEAGVGAVMNSYNPLNGVHTTQSNYLNNEILKKSWGFDGILMSDWDATYDAIAAAKGGLDLEMPSAKMMNRTNLIPAVKNGSLSESTINDKVSRILRVIFRFGFYDRPQLDETIPKDNPEGALTSLDLARGGIVLLKNKDKILPLSKKIKTLAVIGPNANTYIAGGGSSYTFPFHSVNALQGLQKLAGPVKIVYTPGIPPLSDLVQNSVFYTGKGSKQQGLKAEYFDNIELQGSARINKVDPLVRIHNGWGIVSENRGIPFDHTGIRWTGVVRPESSGSYKFTVRGFDGFRLWVNGKQVINLWQDQGITTQSANLYLEKGKDYTVKLEYYANSHPVDISFAWYKDKIDFSEVKKVVSNADAAIVCVGFNESSERESMDRTFELPQYQDSLINFVAENNPNTIVSLNAGGNVDMTRWSLNVKGLLHCWYAGQEGGTALAEILYGKVSPSGKLPVSFEKSWPDNPTYKSYYDVGGNKQINYSEGLFLGYRYYDSKKLEPQFPFGFGLSYTEFKYEDLRINETDSADSVKITVSFKITNTGNQDGSEIAQLYVSDKSSPVPRPEKELKGFTKVHLKKGESKEVSIELGKDAFSYYKTEKKDFEYDQGEFGILIGASSRDIRLKNNIVLK